jgi:putative nucleotidyltransferase with HDIG domain
MIAKKISEQQIVDAVEKLPVLSEIVNRGLSMLRDDNCSIRDITELIGKDQSISAKVIKLANSAFYGFPRQISTLSEAIVIVGFNSLKTLLITASVSEILKKRIDGYMLSEGYLWKHSYAVAYTSSILAKVSGLYDSDKAFTAGVLHDIGKLILDTYLKGQYKRLIILSKQENMDFTQAEKKFLGFHHGDVGGIILEKWNFPPTVANAVRHHHKPLCNGDKPQENIDLKLHGLIYLANMWVKEAGIGVSIETYGENYIEHFEKQFNITPDKKEQVMKFLSDEMSRMKDLFPEENIKMEVSILK